MVLILCRVLRARCLGLPTCFAVLNLQSVRHTMAASKSSKTSSEPLFPQVVMAQGEYSRKRVLVTTNVITRAPPRGSQKTAGALGKGTVIASASKMP